MPNCKPLLWLVPEPRVLPRVKVQEPICTALVLQSFYSYMVSSARFSIHVSYALYAGNFPFQILLWVQIKGLLCLKKEIKGLKNQEEKSNTQLKLLTSLAFICVQLKMTSLWDQMIYEATVATSIHFASLYLLDHKFHSSCGPLLANSIWHGK